MKIDHIAIWADDLDQLSRFYATYFGAEVGELYSNTAKGFTSRFLTFGSNGCRIEVMNKPGVSPNINKRGFAKGLAHFSISVGSRRVVDELTERLRKDGFIIENKPRTTGDGHYESAVLDPEGNLVEIME